MSPVLFVRRCFYVHINNTPMRVYGVIGLIILFFIRDSSITDSPPLSGHYVDDPTQMMVMIYMSLEASVWRHPSWGQLWACAQDSRLQMCRLPLSRPPPPLANLTHSPRGLGRHCLLPSLWVPKSNPEEPSWKTPSANSAHLNQGDQVGRDPAARMFRVYRSHRNTLIRGKKIGFRLEGRSFNRIENILGFN